MRLSVDIHDVAYNNDAAFDYEAFVDGVKLEYCITADEELGKAWAYIKDNEGNFVTSDGLNLVLKEFTGKVELRRIDHAKG
jgi:hypothetical protein